MNLSRGYECVRTYIAWVTVYALVSMTIHDWLLSFLGGGIWNEFATSIAAMLLGFCVAEAVEGGDRYRRSGRR